MKKINNKKVPVLLSIILIFTMVFGTGSVFANQHHPINEVPSRLIPSENYVSLNYVGDRHHVTISAAYYSTAKYVTGLCEYSVDHNEIIDVEKGTIIAKQKGVATITVTYQGAQTQIMVDVK